MAFDGYAVDIAPEHQPVVYIEFGETNAIAIGHGVHEVLGMHGKAYPTPSIQSCRGGIEHVGSHERTFTRYRISLEAANDRRCPVGDIRLQIL